MDKHYGYLHSNNFIGCDSELVFLFQSGLRNLQTHASNDHPPHYFMNEGCCLLATRTPVVPPLLIIQEDSIGRRERQSHSFTSPVTPVSHTLGKKRGMLICCILVRYRHIYDAIFPCSWLPEVHKNVYEFKKSHNFTVYQIQMTQNKRY